MNEIPEYITSEMENPNPEQPIPGYSSMEQFTKEGFKLLMEAIKNSNALPSGSDWNFYKTSAAFKEIIDAESANVLRSMNDIVKCTGVDSVMRNKILDEKIELIIEANDVILEKVANNIDDLSGVRKTLNAPVVLESVSSAQLSVNGSWNKRRANIFLTNAFPSRNDQKNENNIKLLTARNIIRPQKFFKDQIDNRNKVPWCPRISDKPNSLKPLAIFLEECEDRQEYSHPYEYELDRFQPTPAQLLKEKPDPPKPLNDTPLVEINKPEQLNDLVETLRKCKEFAVDVEHHSYRSFMGITCLLQISTADTDYLIDTLALRDKLCILNEVFTRNNIVKIFHGAEMDIEWLQRDLSIYVVNMFDTYQAAKILQYPALSLAFLLKKFCDICPNKQFQLADWRIRELPEELKKYAREDTHYLIYIYKMLKKELWAKANGNDNLIRAVVDRSTEICKIRYFKPILNDDSHLAIYRKCKKMFDNRQLYALKKIYQWRDLLARQEDESCGYVLPNHMLLQIAETLPREMQGILACCRPIPPLVRSHLLELHNIVLKAREQSLEKAIMNDTNGRGVLKKTSRVNVDSILHCPHDLSKTNEFRDDLPTLLTNNCSSKSKNNENSKLKIEKLSSHYSIFNDFSDSRDMFDEREIIKKLRGFCYFSPYERYKLVKPYAIDENKKEEQKESEKVENKTNQERTDEDRIASIKNHFMQLSQKFSEELQLQQRNEEEQRQQESMRETAGSRKRKREDDSDSYEETTMDSDVHVVQPVKHGNVSKRGNKRKFDEMVGEANKNKRNQQRVQRFKQKTLRQQRQQQNHNAQQEQDSAKQQIPKNQKPNTKKNKKKNKNIHHSMKPFAGTQNKPQKGWKNNQNQKQPKKWKGQGKQDSFSPYDYGSVDFRQFQGGAGSANSGAQIKQGFKPKTWRNRNNKFGSKSATFSNTKSNWGAARGAQHNRY